MSHNWGFVTAGYLLTAVGLGGYYAWVKVRARQLRRSLRDEHHD